MMGKARSEPRTKGKLREVGMVQTQLAKDAKPTISRMPAILNQMSCSFRVEATKVAHSSRPNV